MKDIFIKILTSIGTAMLVWVSERIIKFINTKIQNAEASKFLVGATEIVTAAVKATYQEYVESLKNSNSFSKEAQKEALELAKVKIYAELSTPVQNYITTNIGNIDEWIDTTIHSVLYDLKK